MNDSFKKFSKKLICQNKSELKLYFGCLKPEKNKICWVLPCCRGLEIETNCSKSSFLGFRVETLYFSTDSIKTAGCVTFLWKSGAGVFFIMRNFRLCTDIHLKLIRLAIYARSTSEYLCKAAPNHNIAVWGEAHVDWNCI